jgi:glycosyltransferase involved in cell wall biosynthesis
MDRGKGRSVLFLVRGGETVPSCRFRAWQYLEPMRKLGIDAQCVVLEKSRNPLRQLLFHLRLIPKLRRYDAVVFQKLLEPRRLAFIRLFNGNLHYDFDDAMYLAPDGADFPATMRAAPHVIAGNATLAARARRHNPNVSVVPTVVPMPPVASMPPPGSGDAGIGSRTRPLVLSWIGTADMNMPYVASLVGILDGLPDQVGGMELRILTDKPESAPRRPWIKAMKWSRRGEEEEFRNCDVGLMPLPDDEWCAGKCACKALQYLSYGKPIITSPVGVNKELFRDTAFAALAETPDEWRAALERFRADEAARYAAGSAGRAFVAENFSLEVWAPRLAARIGVA